MRSAILLAGGNTKPTLRSKIAIKYHQFWYKGERYLWDQYKPITPVDVGGITKPSVAHVLDSLRKIQSIDDIVVVGDEFLLTKHLDLSGTTFVPQGKSLAENAYVGYTNSNAKEKSEHALFVSSDIPYVRPQSFEIFILQCPCESDLEFGVSIMDDSTSRHSVKLRKLSEPNNPLVKYRCANILNARIPSSYELEDLKGIDFAYKIRKMREPKAIFSAIAHFTPFALKYFTRRATVQDAQFYASKYLGLSVKLIELADGAYERDVDSDRDIHCTKN